MDNQHRKITGYRELSQEEIDLMNAVKECAEVAGRICTQLESLRPRCDGPDADKGPDQRWVAIGKTDLQKGFMALVRSIAKPESF